MASSTFHLPSKTLPKKNYIFSTLHNYPKPSSERMPTCYNLSKKPILREGHITSSFIDQNLKICRDLDKLGWLEYALSNFDVYDYLVRWFYKYVTILIDNHKYSSTVTWSVDIPKDGETLSFKYDSKDLQKDFGITIYGFNDLSVDEEKSHAWKPLVDRLKAYEYGKKIEISLEEKISTKLVQNIFMPTTHHHPYQQNAQFTIASKLLINEPINLPIIIAKHMSMAQCDPEIPTIPYGGLVTFIMKKWLLLQPYGIKKESFYFESDIFDDQRKIIKELFLTKDILYESDETEDEEEEKLEETQNMVEDVWDEPIKVHTEEDSSDEEEGEVLAYTVEEMLDLHKAKVLRRHQRIRAELRSMREIVNGLAASAWLKEKS